MFMGYHPLKRLLVLKQARVNNSSQFSTGVNRARALSKPMMHPYDALEDRIDQASLPVKRLAPRLRGQRELLLDWSAPARMP
jgi:hypothetical protein